MLRSIGIFIVTAFAISLGAQAHAQNVTETFKLKNRGLTAHFFGVEENPTNDSCAAVAISVFYSETVTRTDGNTEVQGPSTYVELDYQNPCAGGGVGETLFLSGTGFVQTATIRGDGGRARLNATVPVMTGEDYEGEPVSTTVSLDLEFAATGPATTHTERFRSDEGGVKFKFTSTSQSRPAEAAGVATAELPISGTANLIFVPTDNALISRNTQGSVTITRPVD